MAHFERFGAYTGLATVETTRPCTLKTTAILTHCGEKRATHQAINEHGSRVLLCRYCASYVEAYQWAARLRLPPRGEIQISALALVWRCPTGFQLPMVKDGLRSLRHFGAIAKALEDMTKAQLMQKINGRYLLRDACPGCLQREAHDKDCRLRFDPEQFAERRHATL